MPSLLLNFGVLEGALEHRANGSGDYSSHDNTSLKSTTPLDLLTHLLVILPLGVKQFIGRENERSLGNRADAGDSGTPVQACRSLLAQQLSDSVCGCHSFAHVWTLGLHLCFYRVKGVPY